MYIRISKTRTIFTKEEQKKKKNRYKRRISKRCSESPHSEEILSCHVQSDRSNIFPYKKVLRAETAVTFDVTAKSKYCTGFDV